jgi:ATP-dependent protease HslVU (ClpYQ) ATPase subunit
MIGEQLCDEKAQSIRDLVEEAMKAPPQKTKKNTKRKDQASPSKVKAHEKLLPSSLEGREKRMEISKRKQFWNQERSHLNTSISIYLLSHVGMCIL